MNKIFNIHKPLGLTPLEALERLRKKKKLPKGLKMSYAGRLDPMAEGVLLIVAGKELKNREKYLKLPKVYKAKILLGISTDTWDILGKVKDVAPVSTDKAKILGELKRIQGRVLLPIPPFSSPAFKKNYLSARKGAGKLKKRLMVIKGIKGVNVSKIPSTSLLKYVNKSIPKVSGDFRQKEILQLWKRRLKSKMAFPAVELEVSCESGTYIRSLAHSLGARLKTPSVLLSLKRTRVGKYTAKNRH